MEENSVNNVEQAKEVKKSKFWSFVKKHKMSSFLFALLLISVIWGLIKVYSVERKYSKELQMAKEINIKQVAKTLSWVISNDKLLIDGKNTGQIEIYFNDFIKEEGVKKIMLLEYPANKVILSTDSKDMGETITLPKRSDKHIEIVEEKDVIKAVSPIVVKGLSQQFGTLVIEYKKP